MRGGLPVPVRHGLASRWVVPHMVRRNPQLLQAARVLRGEPRRLDLGEAAARDLRVRRQQAEKHRHSTRVSERFPGRLLDDLRTGRRVALQASLLALGDLRYQVERWHSLRIDRQRAAQVERSVYRGNREGRRQVPDLWTRHLRNRFGRIRKLERGHQTRYRVRSRSIPEKATRRLHRERGPAQLDGRGADHQARYLRSVSDAVLLAVTTPTTPLPAARCPSRYGTMRTGRSRATGSQTAIRSSKTRATSRRTRIRRFPAGTSWRPAR